jgi:hypothetical protein
MADSATRGPMPQGLALLPVTLARLLAEEGVDVGIAPAHVGAPAGHEGLDARGRVAEGAAQGLDDVPELLLLELVEERGALEGAELGLDAHRVEVVEPLCCGRGGV